MSEMNGTEELAIRIRGMTMGFGEQLIHNGIDLDVRKGEVIGIVGGSGTGKSVLMRCIIGLLQPWSGDIEVMGQSISDLGYEQRRKLDSRWGVLFQDGALFSSQTVAQNIMVPLREFCDMPEELMEDIAALKISLVGLSPEAGPKFPSELSGGMRKRAGIARALALDPDILFLDEPTAGLDPIGAAAFDELIRKLHETLGLTVVMITHDLDSLHAICDRIAVLADGQVALVGTMDEMLASDHPWIRDYFHGPRGRAAHDSQDRAPTVQV